MNRLQPRVGMAYSKLLLHKPPQLLRHGVARPFDLEVAPLAGDLLSSVGTPCVTPSGVCPPLLDLFDFLFVALLLGGGARDLFGHAYGWNSGGEDLGDGGEEVLESFGQVGGTGVFCLGWDVMS